MSKAKLQRKISKYIITGTMLKSMPLLIGVLLVASAWSAAPTAPSTADVKVKSLYEAEWSWRAKELGGQDTDDAPKAGYLPQVDAGSQQRRLTYWKDALARLDAIPENDLVTEKVNAAVFRAVLEAFIAQRTFRTYEAPFNSGSSFWLELAPRSGFANAAEYHAYLGRMKDVPRYFDQEVENMRAGLKRGFTAPRVTIQGRDQTIVPFTNTDPDQNPFFGPFKEMPPGVPQNEREALSAEARELIRHQVAPRYAKLLPFIRDEYIPHARASIAAEQLPDGKNFYRAQIREYTTLDLTPLIKHPNPCLQRTVRQSVLRQDSNPCILRPEVMATVG